MPDVLYDPQFQSRISNTQGYIGASGPFYTAGSRAFAIYTAGTLPADLSELIVYGNIPGAFKPDANLLLHLTSWGGVTISVTSDTTVGNYGLITVTTSAGLALESGTAAEFLYYNTSSFNDDSTLYAAVAGTVSLAGGGGDLVIDNVNLVQGASYSISQWRHKVYQDFTYV
jgi:hypothetical protein